jgi:quinol monooxygenase YgiN
LISADARLTVADIFAGRLDESGYFAVYERWPFQWKMVVGEVDGESVVILLRLGVDAWTPHSIVRLDVVDQRVERITDYYHCPWVLESAASTKLTSSQHSTIQRRDFLQSITTAVLTGVILPSFGKGQAKDTMSNKYGFCAKFKAKTGKGKDLAELMLKDVERMKSFEGCQLYVISKPAGDVDAVFVKEIWDTKEDHDKSLKLPEVRELISQAMPMIDGPPETTTLEVLGGTGI